MDRTIFIAPETLEGFLDGQAADVHLDEGQRQNQYLADVLQENADRETRSVDLLDPNSPATRDRRNATQVSNHERLFPFSDNLTTLMFLVASDLGEAQKETHEFPVSSRN